MKKRGQVTLFIIIAIAIVAVVVLVFLFEPQVFKLQKTPPEVLATKQLVDDCLKEKTIEAANIIGASGGHISPTPSFDTYLGRIALWYDLPNNSDFRPSLQTIENEIADYVQIQLPLCIIDSDTKNEINWTEPKIEVQILEEHTTAKASMPITLRKGNETYRFESFEVNLPVRLYEIYNVAYNISEQEMKNKRLFSPKDLEPEDFNLILITYQNDTIIYFLQDPESQINNQTYVFMFAGKFM